MNQPKIIFLTILLSRHFQSQFLPCQCRQIHLPLLELFPQFQTSWKVSRGTVGTHELCKTIHFKRATIYLKIGFQREVKLRRNISNVLNAIHEFSVTCRGTWPIAWRFGFDCLHQLTCGLISQGFFYDWQDNIPLFQELIQPAESDAELGNRFFASAAFTYSASLSNFFFLSPVCSSSSFCLLEAGGPHGGSAIYSSNSRQPSGTKPFTAQTEIKRRCFVRFKNCITKYLQ